jgi:hypothetical protein
LRMVGERIRLVLARWSAVGEHNKRGCSPLGEKGVEAVWRVAVQSGKCATRPRDGSDSRGWGWAARGGMGGEWGRFAAATRLALPGVNRLGRSGTGAVRDQCSSADVGGRRLRPQLRWSWTVAPLMPPQPPQPRRPRRLLLPPPPQQPPPRRQPRLRRALRLPPPRLPQQRPQHWRLRTRGSTLRRG